MVPQSGALGHEPTCGVPLLSGSVDSIQPSTAHAPPTLVPLPALLVTLGPEPGMAERPGRAALLLDGQPRGVLARWKARARTANASLSGTVSKLPLGSSGR